MFNYVAFFVLCFGALNWLSIGAFQFDLIAGIFGSQANFISRFLYVIVGLAGLYMLLYCLFKKGNFKLSKPKEENEKQKPVKAKASKQ